MPFIIATSYRQLQSTAAVAFVDAGENQILICDPGTVLTATVIGDLTGKTVEWEQLTGAPVTFTTSVYALSVNFTQSDFTDKTFKFTVDKGLPTAKSDTIATYGTPTFEYYTPSAPSPNLVTTSLTIELHGSRASILNPEAASCNSYTTAIIAYQPISVPVGMLLVGYVVETNGSGAWTPVTTLLPTDQSYVVTADNSLYRIVAVLQRTGGNIEYVASNALYISGKLSNRGNGLGADAAQLAYASSPATVSITNVVVDTLSLISCDPVDFEDLLVASPAATSITNVVVDVLSLIGCDPDDFEDLLVASPAATSITNVVVADLTGGSIGGP